MPLVAHNALPTFKRLKHFGLEIMDLDDAVHQDIRELHIGLLNMMPDAALTATEHQFINLVGNCNKIAQFYVYPFSLTELNRGAEAEAHIRRHYAQFTDLREQGLDALIITGANVANPSLDQEPFWEPLMEVVEWAEHNVTSILCSCLATHAVLKHHHGIERQLLPRKQWGVYSHRVTWPEHPLVRDINTRFDAPHSRHNDISRDQLEAARLVVLAESEEAGVHLAVSPDLFRIIYFQGHPEYDAFSLLKEYKREVLRYLGGERPEPPPFPEHYFSGAARQLARGYLDTAARAGKPGLRARDFPEEELTALVDNTWRDTGKAIVNNWLGLVYRLTSLDRRQPFMEGVDPQDPLRMRLHDHL
jgi:homoserine O-succinyltransferase